MGVNMADLYNAVPPVKGIFIYQRQKTRNRREDHAEMHVKVPDQLKPYIERLSKHARKNYWLNLSWRYSSVSSATKTVNQLLKAWSIRHGVKPFTFYAARKSWATIARSRECGVDKALVDECLDHIGDYKLTDIYVPRDWELMWEANAKVCDLVFK